MKITKKKKNKYQNNRSILASQANKYYFLKAFK